MSNDITTALKVLGVLVGATALIWIGIVMVTAAKRGGGRMQGIGVAPPVAEAQDTRIRKGTHYGDPPAREPSERS